VTDLAVVGQDPRFGGGALAQQEAFLEGATALGRTPTLLYRGHPTLAGRTITVDRIEVVRQLRAARSLRQSLAEGRSAWVVATLATNGVAAARCGRAYGCWLAASLDDEWGGRARSLDPLRRLAQRVNAPFLRPLERAVIRGAARVYTISPNSRAAIARASGLPEQEIGILSLPVNVDALRPEPDEVWQARLDAPTITFVGRADDPRKNLDLLLDALPLIRARVPGARLRLIGRPPRELPDGVEALGEVDSIAAPLRESSLFVLPSWQEGFGIVAAEALASGVPVVTTPSGGPEHLVRASGGGRVLSGWGSEELAATVTELLGDAATLGRMRVAGRDHVVREHSPDRFRVLLADALRAVDEV
jgi:glycosyltransferase involved in cell wall biosynthesis